MSDQEKKDHKYNTKRPGAKKNSTNKSMKSNNGDRKFKGKKDTRNKYSQSTNGVHNNMPLTKEH